MNDDFWNLGNEETTPDADDVVSESGQESTDTSLPVKHEVTAQDRAEVSSTVSDFSDLKMVLSDLPQDVVDNMPTIQNRILLCDESGASSKVDAVYQCRRRADV